jgi:pimeloyl-ACP methyl ester carboxylesterase
MDHGRFWIGAGGEAPMHVEWLGPEPAASAIPLVLIHGGGGQGTDWLTTPDGRPGWADALARRGHRVFVVDRPGHGRGAAWADALGAMGPTPSVGALAALFRPDAGAHPAAELHTQWPSDPGPPESDPVLAQQLAASRPMPIDLAPSHALERRLGAELLDRIGPAILFTHSAGGAAGWLIAAERPELVRAIVAIEPIGPPFREAIPGVGLALPSGLTAVPLSGLDGLPVVLVSAEASMFRHFDAATRDFLVAHGAAVNLVALADHGVHGNGHGMTFERNHLDVLDVVMTSLQKVVPIRGSG